MFDIQRTIDPFIYSKFTNNTNKIYILKGFYDLNINNSVYYRINMLLVRNGLLRIYSIGSIILSIKIEDIDYISIYDDYRKLNFKISGRQ